MAMASTKVLGWAWIVALLLSGCSSPEAEARRGVQQIGAARLHADAALFQQSDAAGQGASTPSQWPETFRQLHAVRAEAFMFGLLLVTREDGEEEHGIYIITDPAGTPPEDGSGIVNKRITDSIYWVKQKVRRPIRPSPEEPTPAP